MPKEFPPLNDEFIKAAISSGSLTPPPNEGHLTRVERFLMRVIWLMIALGVAAMAIAWFAIKT